MTRRPISSLRVEIAPHQRSVVIDQARQHRAARSAYDRFRDCGDEKPAVDRRAMGIASISFYRCHYPLDLGSLCHPSIRRQRLPTWQPLAQWHFDLIGPLLQAMGHEALRKSGSFGLIIAMNIAGIATLFRPPTPQRNLILLAAVVSGGYIVFLTACYIGHNVQRA